MAKKKWTVYDKTKNGATILAIKKELGKDDSYIVLCK